MFNSFTRHIYNFKLIAFNLDLIILWNNRCSHNEKNRHVSAATYTVRIFVRIRRMINQGSISVLMSLEFITVVTSWRNIGRRLESEVLKTL